MFNARVSLRNEIIMDKLMDDLDFCKDFLTAQIPSVRGILVYKDCTPSETIHESSVMLLTFFTFFNEVS